MRLNTNNVLYIIAYACGVVLIVALLLAFTQSSLKPYSDANERIDQQRQILASLGIEPAREAIEQTYAQTVIADPIVDTTGQVVQAEGGFQVKRKDIGKPALPVYVCQVNGEKKYVLPLVGKGLWGTIWGYLALNDDCSTVYGAYFSHESETAGLGALIAEKKFQEGFRGKHIATPDGQWLSVTKHGAKQEHPQAQCDGISGATLTTNGVNAMLADYLSLYHNYLSKVKAENKQ